MTVDPTSGAWINPADPTIDGQIPTASWIGNRPAPNIAYDLHLLEQQLNALRKALTDWVYQNFVIAVKGIFVEGETALSQLQAWAESVVSTLAQDFLDTFINFLTGDTSTGHHLSELVPALIGYLEHIPQAFVTGLTTSLASLLSLATWNTFLANANTALATGGSDLTHLTTGLQNIPQGNIGGLLTTLGSLLPTSTWNSFLAQANTALGTAGSDLTHLINGLGLIPQGNISGLANRIQYLAGTGQFDASQLANLLNIPTGIPNTAVTSILGGTNIGADLQATIGAVYQGITQQAGGTLTGIQQQFNNALLAVLGYVPGGGAAPPPTSLAGNVTNRAITKPSWANIDPTLDAVFTLSSVMTQGTLPTLAVTAGTGVIGFIPIPDSGAKEAIAYLGYPTGGSMGTFTDFRLNIYQVNTNTGALTWLYTTPDLLTSSTPPAGGTTPVWNYWDLPTASFIGTNQGNVYAVELVVFGSGTYNLLGLTNSLPAHPSTSSVYPKQLAATRSGATSTTAPASISSPTYSTNTPWFGLSGSPSYPPILTSFGASGTYTVPTWANHVDIIAIGAGGGGGAGGPTQGKTGGAAGSWNAVTLSTATVTGTLTITVGAGGGGGVSGNIGGQGGASTVAVPGWGSSPLSAAGGGGGFSGTGTPVGGGGAGAGNEIFDFNTYYGGGPQSSAQGNGNAPGGGGGGGNATVLVGQNVNGGNGANGAVFILAYT